MKSQAPELTQDVDRKEKTSGKLLELEAQLNQAVTVEEYDLIQQRITEIRRADTLAANRARLERERLAREARERDIVELKALMEAIEASGPQTDKLDQALILDFHEILKIANMRARLVADLHDKRSRQRAIESRLGVEQTGKAIDQDKYFGAGGPESLSGLFSRYLEFERIRTGLLAKGEAMPDEVPAGWMVWEPSSEIVKNLTKGDDNHGAQR